MDQKEILLIGAGRSAGALIQYLQNYCSLNGHKLRIISKKFFLPKNTQLPREIEFIETDVLADDRVDAWIGSSDLVISMLPVRLHLGIAKKCLQAKVHFLTASYVSDEMKSLDQEAKARDVLFLNECGLDPGLDHMSAMKIIHHIKDRGGRITGFESFTGGLVSEDSADNPWKYKLTWNPRNVVLAGVGAPAVFLQEGTIKHIPYQQLFSRTERMKIEGLGAFEGYANRDSLKYKALYKLSDALTVYRGTLRRPGFCKAWNLLISLGITDDSYVVSLPEDCTYKQFTNMFLSYHPEDSVERKLYNVMGIKQDDFDLQEKIKYLGLFSEEKIGLKEGTPAQILQRLLEKKWKLKPEDKDLIVMWHKFDFELEGEKQQVYSTFAIEGENQSKTAMARTVGLPLGIAAKLILEGKIPERGVHIPVLKSVYQPILEELLSDFDISFKESGDL